MNTRRPLFADRRVREALALAFDFEWCNKNLFYDAYTRTESYFANSDLACSSVPEGEELALLEPWRAQLPPELFTTPFKLPKTDGSGNNRAGLRRAMGLLREAGWQVKEFRLVDAQGGPFRFEILLSEPSFERVALPYKQWLGRLGIDAQVRTVDPAQYQRRLDTYDFDMVMAVIPETDSPGNEQIGYWSCASAKLEGGDNLMGACNPVVEALLPKVVQAPDRAHLLVATHALDRVLLWEWYMVPNWYLDAVRIAYWDKFGRPTALVRPGVVFDSWWIDRQKLAALEAARRGQS
jgi:microcin C transport system substrate-binding protein